jgi:hypothetical protein
MELASQALQQPEHQHHPAKTLTPAVPSAYCYSSDSCRFQPYDKKQNSQTINISQELIMAQEQALNPVETLGLEIIMIISYNTVLLH